ncbi:MAG TPA: hypothetical protein ENK25_04150 [Bacteroidetes bacterium]|nr:hypothetical protein [Bacteroidota bacterium]
MKKNRIHSFYTFSFLIIILLMIQGCQKLPVYTSPPLQMPGSLVRMATLPLSDSLVGNKKGIYTFSVEHDTANLYVFLRVRDRSLQTKIMVTGMTLWIDTTGHKKHKMGIQYPLKREKIAGNRPAPIRPSKPRPVSPLHRGNPGRAMKVTGFSGKGSESVIPANRQEGLAGHIAYFDRNMWSYVVRIPLDSLHYNITDHPFSLGIETGSIEAAPSGGERPGMRTGGGAMGGVPHVGGRGGMRGGRSVSSAEMEQRRQMLQGMTQPTKFWVQVIIKK